MGKCCFAKRSFLGKYPTSMPWFYMLPEALVWGGEARETFALTGRATLMLRG